MPAEETDDRYAALEAAFDAAQAPANEQAEVPANEDAEPEKLAPTQEEAKEGEQTETAAEARARDDKGRFAPKTEDKAPDAAKPTPPEKAAAPGAVPPVEVPKAVTPAPEALKPPQSWKPAAREGWGSVPAPIQQEIHRREREAKQALDETATARDFHGRFQQAYSPYAAMIQASGQDPVQAAAGLFQAQYVLTHGSPQQKAQGFANLINQSGVPLELVNQYLGGQPANDNGQRPGPAADPNALAQQIEARIIERMQAQRAQAEQAKHRQESATFAQSHEFFEDVRADMADILEMSGKRGVAMTLEAAYNKACQLHPEISGVLSQRAEAQRANAPKASTQRAKAAASSVRSNPGGSVSAGDQDDRRAQLEAAFDAAQGR